MKIRIAEINIEIKNRYPYLPRFCADYLADFDTPDMVVSIPEETIESDLEKAIFKGFSKGYVEAVSVYRAIAEELPRFDAFVFHAAVISYKGKAFAFSAPSGTGKTTHIHLWQKVFGDAVMVLNGDKPIIRIKDGVPVAYGTPWCGKEGMQKNSSAPLAALAFIERAEKNRVAPITEGEYLARVFRQVYTPENDENRLKFLDLLNTMALSVPTYLLRCNMQDDAALVAASGMIPKDI